MKKLLLTLIGGCAALGASAEISIDYYRSLEGLTGRELKDAIHLLVNNDVKMLSYGSGNYATWWGFYVTDCIDGNQVLDRYSNDVFTFGERGKSVSGMNIEHSFPKSWWGGSENNAYKDLYNLMPCQSTINNHKSNYPMGKVDTEWRGNGLTKVGNAAGETAANLRYWEPGDQWKGDFARGYFYMATAYQNFTWSGDQSPRILTTGAYPTLQQWASDLYLQWMRQDPVGELEAQRNDLVERMQRNRNPYVDFVNLAEYVWGDSIGVPFHPLTSVKSADFYGGGTILPATSDEIMASSFLIDPDRCTVVNGEGHTSGVKVWTNTAEYGWKATGQKGANETAVKYQTNSALMTPEIDLSGCSRAWFSFDHAVNYAEAPYYHLTVEVHPTGEEPATINVIRWPLGNKWDFYTSGIFDLSPWAGKKVKVAFRYTSTPEATSVWEIKNMKVETVRGESSVEFIEQDMLDAEDNLPEEVYTIDGRRLPSREGVSGPVIIRRGFRSNILILRN